MLPVRKASLLSTDSSHQSYYTADTSPLSYLTTSSNSTLSSNASFPYSVTSINSYKSRKNVLYPRRVHPLPIAVSLGHPASVSPDALIWQVRFLCTTLLPYAETRLVPAGRLLLQSLGLHGDFSQRVSIRTDEETRCCSELFIVLTHEVLLKDAVSAGELEGPCKLLHRTFKDILSKSGTFSAPKLDEAGLKASSAEALELERFSSVLRALSSVMDAFEGALDSTKSATAKDGALQDHHRMALLELSVSTGLTMEQYRKKLDQNLAQTQTRLNSFLGQTEGLLPRPTSTINPHQGAISTIEEGSEAEGEGSSANGHVQSHSTLSHSTQSHSDSGKRTNSLPRRILRHILPSSMGKKGG
ncbi:hypothetical protein H4582DRAFT_2014085 [Lactarius indigo]|nr:hypothetical protein H4582DRAFT_2014085 [Lactarius indigo]